MYQIGLAWLGLAWPGSDLTIESDDIETRNTLESIELPSPLCLAAQRNNGSVALLHV